MSSAEKVGESAPRVIRDKNYVFDEKLQIIPGGFASEPTLPHQVPSTFPPLKTFAHLAYLAYYDHPSDGSLKFPPEEQVELDGFKFLAAAKNPAKRNGYYGIAYVNEERRQIVLSHRGTNPSTPGALFTDVNGIVLKNFVPQVSSAMTFAHKVVEYAVLRGYEFFFTGHSLGAWLAQITTFSTMFLTLDQNTGHFVGKQSPHSDVRMPYTVVFDSPGALNYLTLLKQALFHLQGVAQEISVEALPVEVFLFHPNYVNSIDLQIGRVFILDVEKVGVVTNKYFGRGTHGMGPVVKLLNELGEEDAVKWRVTDYRVTKMEVAKSSWSGENKTVPWDTNTFPAYFFSREERKFLDGAEGDFPPEGQFEGVNCSDEETANSLVGVTNKEHLWKLARGEESVVTSDGWNRREFIPRVRHIARCLRHCGTLWWNPTRPQLPTNYVDRRICPTEKLEEFTELSAKAQEKQNEIKHFSATEVLMKNGRLVLFVDPPGMGKSSSMTQLELQLRSEASSPQRVILRLNLNCVQDILESEDAEKETSWGPQSVMRFIEKFVANIPVTLLQQTFPGKLLPLYVLLDGLDEVCPLYEQIMLRLLRRLLAHTPQRLFCVHKVILTTRPHLQKLFQDAFNVQANSLLPLQFKQQVEFLEKEVGLSFDAELSLDSLPSTVLSLMGNPLILSLYVQVLKSQGTEAVVNIFDLYSQFVSAKHELHVVEKEEAEPAKMTTRRRVRSMLDDNLRFYFACAVEELVGIRSLKTTRKAILGKRKASDLGVEFLEQPTGKKLEELISFGLLLNGGRFKHRSFAEFFYAQLLTHEAKEYKQFREVLFGRMYEDNVNDNVEPFLCEILLRRQAERRGRESPESFLREEEAAFFLGKEKLERLVNGWIDSVEDMGDALGALLMDMEKTYQSYYHGPSLSSPLVNVGGELGGAEDKESALYEFYSGRLFLCLCGELVLLRLDYSNPHIFDSIKYDTDTVGLLLRWLRGLGDRSWVRAKVFGMNDGSVAEGGGHLSGGSAEVIRMFAVRTDDVSEFLSHEEISAALNSFDSVVDDNWRMEEVEVEKVRRTLEKYVDPQRLQRSLLAHLTTVDHFLLNRAFSIERQERDLEWSWWYADMFSRSDVVSFVCPYASRVPSIAGIGWRAVQDAWGEEFVPLYQKETLLRIKEGDVVCLINLCEEVERGGLNLEGDLMEAVREMIFGVQSGWEVLEMLERRPVRHVETNSATSLSEGLFEFEDVGTITLETLRLSTFLPSDMNSCDISAWEANVLFGWLPFVIRYSREPETIKRFIGRLSFHTEKLDEDNFGSAARSFLVAYSSEATGSSSVCQLRSFLRGLETQRDSLLNVLLDADEGELRIFIQQNSPGTPPTVTHTPLGSVLTCLLNKKQSTSGESKFTPPWKLTMGSSWDAKSVAFIFTDLIKTSPCYELLRALGNFLSSFPSDLLKETLLSKTPYKYFESKRRVRFRKYEFVNTEGICSLCATIRCYFVVFGEDLQWTEIKIPGYYLVSRMPVEFLSVLEDNEEFTVQGFPPQQIGTKVEMVKNLEKKLRDKVGNTITLSWLAKEFCYETEAEWERLLRALQLIPLKVSHPTGRTSAVVDHIHLGEYLHVAVELGSLEGVKTFAWPGLLKWTNEGGKTAWEVSVELWGVHHEISQFLEERFQAVRAFHEEP